jgi:hypothetical protein
MPVGVNERQYLSPHFQRWEFTVSDTAARRGIPNQPSAAEWANLKALCTHALEPAREALGRLHVTSGYRCRALNTAIGGATGSQHVNGQAADIIPYVGTLPELFKWIYRNVIFDQLILEFDEWIHVSYVDGPRNRREVLYAQRGNMKTLYAPITAEHMEKL